ncbi:MAG: histidine phosphatase family protein [Candidatus Omnitrophica bacterium]|nr:histidine phosphatase family protein [Candidatus Omnitrophota bacterium]
MTNLVLVRHGKTDWNKMDRIQGELDIPLSIEGRRQAQEMAISLSKIKIDAIYSSALSRSYETAEYIAQYHDLKVKKLKSLNELNQGVWQGLRIDEIKKRYKKQFASWRTAPLSVKPPKGEGMKDAYDRIVNAVDKIVERHKAETICVVSHELVSTMIRCHYQGLDINHIWDFVPDNATWEMIEVTD